MELIYVTNYFEMFQLTSPTVDNVNYVCFNSKREKLFMKKE